jgi:hypothetical protein
MKTVSTFMVPYEAHLAKGLLESEGIRTVVVDENVSDQVIYTPAIGGVKVQVLDEDYDRAMKVLGYGQPTAETPQKPAPVDICPQCGSSEITTNPLSPKTILAFLVSLFVRIPILSRRTQKVCRKCGKKW